MISGNNVMVDIETLGTKATSVILSIGAVKFNADAENFTDTFYCKLSISDCLREGMTVDADTIVWWMQQDSEAKKLFEACNWLHADKLANCLKAFSDWIGNHGNVKVWGNGASFDNALLANAYARVGQPLPWKFWNDRCYRTVKSQYPEIKLERVGTHHDALDDAISQAKHLVAIDRFIRKQAAPNQK